MRNQKCYKPQTPDLSFVFDSVISLSESLSHFSQQYQLRLKPRSCILSWTVLDVPMEIDRVPVSQLPSRYGIARSALYTRLKDLKIEPEKQGKKAFVNANQLQQLDALHEHIQKGGTTGEFLKQQLSPGQLATQDSPGQSTILVQDSPGQINTSPTATLVTVLEAIVKRLMPAPSRLSYLRELEEACTQQWLLSTSELADLLGLTPGTITDYGEEFSDAGFTFTRAGKRKGGEIAWRIGKPKRAK